MDNSGSQTFNEDQEQYISNFAKNSGVTSLLTQLSGKESLSTISMSNEKEKEVGIFENNIKIEDIEEPNSSIKINPGVFENLNDNEFTKLDPSLSHSSIFYSDSKLNNELNDENLVVFEDKLVLNGSENSVTFENEQALDRSGIKGSLVNSQGSEGSCSIISKFEFTEEKIKDIKKNYEKAKNEKELETCGFLQL